MAVALLIILFVVIAAIANAVMDTLADKPHFDKSIFAKLNPDYWLKTDSWDNKYKDIDGDGEGDVVGGLKYKWPFGWIANFLDGWHLFKMVMIFAITLPIALGIEIVTIKGFNHWLLDWTVIGGMWILIFNLFYNKILKKK